MFKKREQQDNSQTHVLNGRYVKVEPSKRGGYIESRHDYGYVQSSQLASTTRGISEIDISESYLTDRDEQEMKQKRQDNDKLNKSNRRKIPFLQKKKIPSAPNSKTDQRHVNGIVVPDVDDDVDDDISDITTYDEGIPVVYEGLKKNGVHPLGPNHAPKRLDLDDQYAEEAQLFERMNFIIENYRKPPEYPGNADVDSSGKSMIQQLLQEKANKQIKDNASMINYCQVEVPNGMSMEDLTKIMRASHDGALDGAVDSDNASGNANVTAYTDSNSTAVKMKPSPPEPMSPRKEDQLVMRTLRSPRSPEGTHVDPVTGANVIPSNPNLVFDFQNARSRAKIISEIYPRDYDPDYDNDSADELERDPDPTLRQNIENVVRNDRNTHQNIGQAAHLSAEKQNYIVDVMSSYSNLGPSNETTVKPYVRPPDYHQHPARDYDLPEGDDYVLDPDNLDVESRIETSMMYAHYREKSETFVPPSPYMHAEIPEWLQVYAKASPDLDEFLKWDMFRLPELDCWQTMLKRLYMKELEQIVFWFEEYRQAMQQDMERREKEMGIMRVSMPMVDNRMKKTDV